MGAIGRPLKIVNLDPMAGSTPYDCFADIRDLITVEDVMDNEEYALGPNGGLVYCIEVLERNFTWLTDKLSTENCEYVIFDCPGQIELYTHHKSMKNVFDRINKKLGYQICAVQLVDAHHCSDVSKFIAVLMVCLSATIHLELPMVNVLSKFDMIERYDDLEFPVDFYTKVLDLERLLERLPQDSFTNKFKAFSEGLVEVIESYNLVSFQTLNISVCVFQFLTFRTNTVCIDLLCKLIKRMGTSSVHCPKAEVCWTLCSACLLKTRTLSRTLW